ncbi:MAG: hypothetical protein J0H69_09415 [Burkholderiales bacterium]|jgi:hypothetical protein|nr:hypothetical protein [Burkholderiales bacterium]
MSTNDRDLDDGKSPDEYTDPDLREASEAVMEDTIEAVVPYMPIVLPVMGGAMMFLLAFIAVFMA